MTLPIHFLLKSWTGYIGIIFLLTAGARILSLKENKNQWWAALEIIGYSSCLSFFYLGIYLHFMS